MEGDSLTRTVLNDIAARLVRESASRGTITLGGLTDLLGEQLFQSRAIDKGNESPPTTKLVDAAGETGDVEVSSTGKRPSASSTLTANPEIIMNATKDSTINPLVLKSNTDTLTNSNRELPLTSDIVTVPNMRRDIHGIDSEKTNRCENSVEENIAGKAAAEVVRSSSSFQPSSELATNLEDFADDTTSTSVGVDQSTVSKINSDFPPDFIAQQIITNSFNEMAPATQQESATASNSSDSPTEKIETINKSEVISSRENSIDNILDNDKLSFSLTEDSNTCMAAKSIQEQTDCDTLNAERMHSNIRLESVEVDNSQPISSDSTNILRATTLHETAVVVDECNDSTACRDMAIDLRVSSHQENNVSFYSKDTSGAAEGNTVGIQSVQKKEESAAADAENLDSTSRSDEKISISTELGKTISTPYTSENSAQPTVNGVVDASFAGKTSSNDNTSDRLETLDKSVKFNLQDRKTSEDSEMPHKSTEIETKSKIRDSNVNYSERKIDKERCQSEDQSQSLPLNISDFEPEEKQSPVEAIFAPTIAQSPTKAEGRAIADRNKNNNTARNSSNLRSSPNRLSQSTELLAKRFIPLSMSVLELPDMTHRLPLSESTATLDFVSYSHSLPSSPQKDARGSGDDAMYIGKGAAGFTPEQLIQLGYNKHLGRWRGFPFDTWTCCDTNDLLCPNSKKAKSFISSTSLHNKISMVCKSKSSERKIFDNRIRKSVENSEKIVFTPIRKSTSDFEQDEKIFLKDFFPKTTKKFLVKSKR